MDVILSAANANVSELHASACELSDERDSTSFSSCRRPRQVRVLDSVFSDKMIAEALRPPERRFLTATRAAHITGNAQIYYHSYVLLQLPDSPVTPPSQAHSLCLRVRTPVQHQ